MKHLDAEEAVLTQGTSFLVCHANDLAAARRWPFDYEPKAIVVASGLDEVFMATNHNEIDWTWRDNVMPLGRAPFRSTSVGDVVVKATLEAHLCDEFGWSRLKGDCTLLPKWWLCLADTC